MLLDLVVEIEPSKGALALEMLYNLLTVEHNVRVFREHCGFVSVLHLLTTALEQSNYYLTIYERVLALFE